MQIAGTGIRDWKLQHLAAIVITAYILFVLMFVLTHPDLSAWKALYETPAMKVFTLIFLLQVMIHRWIGMWAVLTDYIKTPLFRLFLEGVIMIALMAYFFWGLMIVSGV